MFDFKESKQIIYALDYSKTAYHTVNMVKSVLKDYGFKLLPEYDLNPNILENPDNNKFYVKRNDSSIIAFRIDSKEPKFKIVASHSDSPALKIKPHGYEKVSGNDELATIAVSGYGAGIWHTWFDRPLKICGRKISVIKNNCSDLIEYGCIGRIPSTAIHMERNINDGKKINIQTDMRVIINSDKDIEDRINNWLSSEIYFVNAEKPEIYENTICSPRIDNLASVFTSLDAFVNSEPSYGVSMIAIFDSEEIGSRTYQGAFSNFLENVISNIWGTRINREDSFIISFDGAHATPINNLSLADSINPVYLGKGIVIKNNDKYCTNAFSTAVFTSLCRDTYQPYQTYTCRSDMICGSTIGSILTSKLGMPGIDVGIPMHGMHSISETADLRDWISSIEILKKFYKGY